MSDHGYNFYMQKCNSEGVVSSDDTAKDLEKDFVGMRYAKCEGINDYGKPRVYTESYADSDKLRTYVPDDLTNDATKIKFTFYFTGDKRQETYHEFVNWVRKGYTLYWDTARNRKFTFIIVDEIKPATEQWHGGTPYLELQLTVQNLKGKTEIVEQE